MAPAHSTDKAHAMPGGNQIIVCQAAPVLHTSHQLHKENDNVVLMQIEVEAHREIGTVLASPE